LQGLNEQRTATGTFLFKVLLFDRSKEEVSFKTLPQVVQKYCKRGPILVWGTVYYPISLSSSGAVKMLYYNSSTRIMMMAEPMFYMFFDLLENIVVFPVVGE
jgi:hypothetical protein